MTRQVLAALAVTALLAVPGQSLAADVQLSGAVNTPLVLDATLLRAQPTTSLDVSFKTAAGEETGHYTGVLLWTLIKVAGLKNAPGKNTQLLHTILVTGADGYSVALSEGEIDPDYQGNKVILAFDGGQPPTSYSDLRLVVPGDAHGGRAVRDVVRVEVK